MANETTRLNASVREIEGSRSNRRLRREGRVPAVLYGGDGEPVHFSVDQRELRHALHARGAVLELSVDGGQGTPAVLKDAQRHPVRGELMHVDLLRVDLNVAIQATVPVHLSGADEAPGVVEGGILEQVTRELTVEALPNDIPEFIEHDVSHMEMLGTELLSAVTAPAGVTFVDDLEETVIATLVPPRVEEEPEEIEEETGIVGEGEGEAEGAPEDAGADEVPADAGEESGGE